MFVFEVTSVEANLTIVNAINPDAGVVVEAKSLPKCIGFEYWSKYDEVRVITDFEVDCGVIVPVVFAVSHGVVADARVIVAEAL